MEQQAISVLVAEGDIQLRRTIAAWLNDEGFTVEDAEDGEEAIRQVQARQFDVMLLDISIPKVNGLEVLRFVRKTSPMTETVMMGINDVTIAIEAMKFGARDYLPKPVDMNQLVPQIRQSISRRDQEETIRRLQAEHSIKLLTDLHNPVAGLRQSISYLLKGMAGPLGDHQKELMSYMTKSIDQVIGLLNEMMDLAKLEGGRIILNRGIGNLAGTVTKVLQEFKVPIQTNKITLDFYAEPELPVVEYDQEKIEQVIVTLLRNAVKYTPPRGAMVLHVRKVQMALEEGQKPSEYLMMAVFNSGAGIAPAQLQTIFDRFRMAQSEQGDQQYGGLGLVICQRIIDAHQGKIWAESEVGKGCTFSFVLPIR